MHVETGGESQILNLEFGEIQSPVPVYHMSPKIQKKNRQEFKQFQAI